MQCLHVRHAHNIICNNCNALFVVHVRNVMLICNKWNCVRCLHILCHMTNTPLRVWGQVTRYVYAL